MKRLATILCGLWAALAFSAGPAHAQKRVALVVGNGAYQNVPTLPTPANDANAIADLFRKIGFDVVEARTDLGNTDFKRLVREFGAIAADADIAVMYFSGHGIDVNGINYLLPVDVKLASDLDAEDEAVSLDRVMRMLRARQAHAGGHSRCRPRQFVCAQHATLQGRRHYRARPVRARKRRHLRRLFGKARHVVARKAPATTARLRARF